MSCSGEGYLDGSDETSVIEFICFFSLPGSLRFCDLARSFYGGGCTISMMWKSYDSTSYCNGILAEAKKRGNDFLNLTPTVRRIQQREIIRK